MTGKLSTPPKCVKKVDAENGVLEVWDPDSFSDPEIVKLKKEGWKIQLTIPDA